MSVYDEKPWLKTYPAWVPPSLPLPTQSSVDLFEAVVRERPGSPCIYYFDDAYTYGDVNQAALALAAALKDLGVKPGDRVVIDMQNIPQIVIASLAVWMRGAIALPLNPMFKSHELQYYINDSEAHVIITQDDVYAAMVKEAIGDRNDITVITTSPLDFISAGREIPGQLKGLEKKTFPETKDLGALLAEYNGRPADVQRVSPEDIAYLVYTSGTTGPAKGAMITHSNVIHNSHVYEVDSQLDGSDVVLGVAPIFHITGIVAHMIIAFRLGLPIVLFHRFDPGDCLRLAEKYKVTFTVAAITVFTALMNHSGLSEFDISSFKKCYSGGAPVPKGMVDRFREATGLTIYNVYGLTESSSPATITPLGVEGPVDEESGALSVGMPVPGHEAWIVDAVDRDREVPIGQEGELVLRGPGITQGYWRKPEETNHAIKDGRFCTGDIAKIDKDGWVYIVDRKKDLINVSGYKVWPREVEDMLYKHPAVKETAVVGVPDEYRGETVKAFVSLRDEFKDRVTSDELIGFCKERMAAFKYPRQIEIIDEIPKTTSGKVLRRVLREK